MLFIKFHILKSRIRETLNRSTCVDSKTNRHNLYIFLFLVFFKSGVICQVAHVTCHMSHFMCHMLGVAFHLSHFTNANSCRHGPPPANSPSMHSSKLLQIGTTNLLFSAQKYLPFLRQNC